MKKLSKYLWLRWRLFVADLAEGPELYSLELKWRFPRLPSEEEPEYRDRLCAHIREEIAAL